ncbi:hypothetical protein Mycsm_05356 [Mycobacterium sp. JS623]|uniref:hypothetical protein n=1 Tax=Mycobacterium sp. JS623 TaxID=212767 RepID=UPI0002A596A7|nr:hypothetical protein [Mycobacterium sp. JS623]AGB25548.1 hypothetical protein Mycsm_05356 [Mycobacterium sp. JS623]
MHVGVFVIVAGAAAATVACGARPEAEPAPPMRTVEPTPAASAVRAAVALPPNADGDPSCPVADAWGKDPFGEGILVTHLSHDTAPVTVLVRTNTGTDVAQRAMLGPGELRLFEFPDVDQSAVSEVLIMTNTLRCYVSADPAAMG